MKKSKKDMKNDIEEQLELADNILGVKVHPLSNKLFRIKGDYKGSIFSILASINGTGNYVEIIGSKIKKQHESEAVNIAYAVLVYLDDL